MKYILVLLIILFSYVGISQSYYNVNLKRVTKISSIQKGSTDTICVTNIDNIKLINKKLKKLECNEITGDPYKWFNKNDWMVKLYFDNHDKILLYRNGYIFVGENAYYSTKNDIDEIIKFINEIH